MDYVQALCMKYSAKLLGIDVRLCTFTVRVEHFTKYVFTIDSNIGDLSDNESSADESAPIVKTTTRPTLANLLTIRNS